MIVRLTTFQWQKLCEEDLPSDALREWVGRDAIASSKKRIDVAMPAIGWKQLGEWLFDRCYDGRGFRTKGVRSWQLKALQSVQRSINVRTVHPALSQTGAIGAINELVPAWKMIGPDDTGRRYTPFPEIGSPFVVLAPLTRRIGGNKVTVWVEAKRPASRPLLDEREHLRFVQMPSSSSMDSNSI